MPDPLPPAPPPDFDRAAAVIEQLRREYDPKRRAAERAARDELTAKYPGQFVAYLDAWDGERLNRQILVASRSSAEVDAVLRARPDLEAIRHVMSVTQIDDPDDDEIWVSWALVDSIEVEPEQEAGDGEPRFPG